jgi:hypothetical protein
VRHLENCLVCRLLAGGSAQAGGGGGGSKRSQINPLDHPECTKTASKRPVSPHLLT